MCVGWTSASPQIAATFCLEVLDSLPFGLLSTKRFDYKKIVDMHDVAPDQAARLAKMVIQKLDTEIKGSTPTSLIQMFVILLGPPLLYMKHGILMQTALAETLLSK